MLVRAALVTAVLLIPAFGERAQKGLFTYQSLGISHNPLGVLLDSRLFWRVPLSDKEGALWENTRFEIGAQSSLTPADGQVGLRSTLEPIGFFSLTGCAYFYGLYNAFGFGMYVFDSSDASYVD